MLTALHRLLEAGFRAQRRIDPFVRPPLRPLLHGPLTRLLQAAINATRPDHGLGLAEERMLDGEDELVAAIVAEMTAHLAQDFRPGAVERGGQTKTYGLAIGELEVLGGLPAHLRHGIFAAPRRYPAWVRFSNPGPHLERDIDDVGVASISVKLMEVEGEKLIDEERHTQDFTTVSTPTFVSRDIRANVALQKWSKRHLGLFYFLDPRASHIRELAMQGLWSRTLSNPLAETYYGCVPYLHGPGQAIQYSFLPRTRVDERIPRLPLRPPDDYLRQALVRSLAGGGAEFVMTVQLQTDPHRMPIEDAAVLWPERLSPRIPVARLHLPRQQVDRPDRIAFDRKLRVNPWHSLAAHRPLGNQNRARLRIYHELAAYRQRMNGEPHHEPTPNDPEFRC